MKRYVMRRSCGPLVFVHDGANTSYLRHLVHHSPTGMEWGYGGSGPSDLARSIVGDLLGTHDPDPAIYQRVKWALVATLPLEGGTITEQQVRDVIAEIASHA